MATKKPAAAPGDNTAQTVTAGGDSSAAQDKAQAAPSAKAPAKAKAATKAKGKPGIRVETRSADKFYRAGRKWTRKPQTLPADLFTEEQIQQLEQEKELLVSHCTIGADGEASQDQA